MKNVGTLLIPNKNFSTNMALDNTVTQFVLAVPTFNRLEKLKILLGSIESQVKSSSYHCRLVISNSESTDGTYDFVIGLKPFGQRWTGFVRQRAGKDN